MSAQFDYRMFVEQHAQRLQEAEQARLLREVRAAQRLERVSHRPLRPLARLLGRGLVRAGIALQSAAPEPQGGGAGRWPAGLV